MEEGGLTQEEIDALLVVDDELMEEEAHSLDDSERDKATGIFQNAIKAGCETLATMVGFDVTGDHITVEATSTGSIVDRFDETFAGVICPLEIGGKSFGHLMALPFSTGLSMANEMFAPGEPPPPDFTDMLKSAYESLLETFNGTMANKLAEESKKKVGSGGPKFVVGAMHELQSELEKIAGSDDLTLIQYDLVLRGQPAVRAMSVISANAVKQLTEQGPIDLPSAKPAVAAAAAAAPAASGGGSGGSTISLAGPMISLPAGVDENLARLLDIPLKITVVLGKTRLEIEKIMDLGAGSIVELDQIHGEPVSILVNGRLFAKGEVVVVEENFGVRISHIITPEERLSLLQ